MLNNGRHCKAMNYFGMNNIIGICYVGIWLLWWASLLGNLFSVLLLNIAFIGNGITQYPVPSLIIKISSTLLYCFLNSNRLERNIEIHYSLLSLWSLFMRVLCYMDRWWEAWARRTIEDCSENGWDRDWRWFSSPRSAWSLYWSGCCSDTPAGWWMLEQETDKTAAKNFSMQINVRYFVKRINYGLIGLYLYVWPVGQLLLFIIIGK